MKWKDRLLSSSLPLEYEVAKILTVNKFSIDFDYSYKRLDNQLEKEFSFDIKASGYYPFSLNSKIDLEVEMLLECKYRTPNVSWLFIKDINIDEYANFSSKGVLKLIDEFSEFTTTSYTSIYPKSTTCLKGVEINTQNGEVHDTGITHGINQLLYSMPGLIHRHIFSSFVGHIDDIKPFIICPILITTADLRILKSNFSIDAVNNANSLDDISSVVPYLRIYSDVYPSFEEHCRNTFKTIILNDNENRLNYFRKLRKNDLDSIINKKNKLISNPELLMIELQKGIGNGLFRETLICNFEHFPKLLEELKKGITNIGKGMKKIKL